jgi:hypothetical protein
MDEAMERILKRDGRLNYKEASEDLLSRFTRQISYLDGGPKRLIGILRELEAWYVKHEKQETAGLKELRRLKAVAA